MAMNLRSPDESYLPHRPAKPSQLPGLAPDDGNGTISASLWLDVHHICLIVDWLAEHPATRAETIGAYVGVLCEAMDLKRRATSHIMSINTWNTNRTILLKRIRDMVSTDSRHINDLHERVVVSMANDMKEAKDDNLYLSYSPWTDTDDQALLLELSHELKHIDRYAKVRLLSSSGERGRTSIRRNSYASCSGAHMSTRHLQSPQKTRRSRSHTHPCSARLLDTSHPGPDTATYHFEKPWTRTVSLLLPNFPRPRHASHQTVPWETQLKWLETVPISDTEGARVAYMAMALSLKKACFKGPPNIHEWYRRHMKIARRMKPWPQPNAYEFVADDKTGWTDEQDRLLKDLDKFVEQAAGNPRAKLFSSKMQPDEIKPHPDKSTPQTSLKRCNQVIPTIIRAKYLTNNPVQRFKGDWMRYDRDCHSRTIEVMSWLTSVKPTTEAACIEFLTFLMQFKFLCHKHFAADDHWYNHQKHFVQQLEDKDLDLNPGISETREKVRDFIAQPKPQGRIFENLPCGFEEKDIELWWRLIWLWQAIRDPATHGLLRG